MRTRDRVAAWTVLVTLAFGVGAIGSSTRWTALITALLGIGCGAIYIGSRRQFERPPALLGLIALAAAFTLFQIIPLPAFLVGLLSPAKLEIVHANALALGESTPSWIALSVDPPATLVALASLVGYLGVGFAAIRVAGTRGGRLFLARAAVGVAAAVALAALLHGVAGLERVFGIYEPQAMRNPRFLAPLLNPNHLAGFLAVATPIAIGLAISEKGLGRFLAAVAGCLCAIVALLAESRTGLVSLAIGIGVCAAYVVPGLLSEQTRRRRQRDRAGTIAIAVIAATVVAVGIYYYGGGTIDEIADTQLDELTGKKSKTAVWAKAAPMIWEYGRAGIGRGAFEPAFTGHSESAFTFSHAENEYLQAVIDWGVFAALGLFVALFFAVRVAARRATQSPLCAGLFAGLVAAAVHHIADFAIELPGVALLVLVAFAALSRAELRKARVKPIKAPIARAAAVGFGVLVIGGAAMFGSSARDEVEALAAAADTTDLELLEARARRGWQRHPRDYRSAGQVAIVLARRRDARAFVVMNRALSMKPNDGSLQHAAARMMLQTQRPSQALGHFRLAIAHSSDPRPVIEELVRRWPDPEVAVTAMPTVGPRQRVYLLVLRSLKATRLIHLYAKALVEGDDSLGYAHLALARTAFEQPDLATAERAGRRALALGHREGAVLAARAQLEQGRAEDAVETIEAAQRAGLAGPRLQVAELRLAARAHLASKEPHRAIAALDRALAATGSRGPHAGAILRQLSKIHEELGNASQAKHYRDLASASQ